MSDNAIRRIQVGDLRKMSDREGLILQGCGGDPQEWLEGINEMLTDAGILRNGSRFERASLFEYDVTPTCCLTLKVLILMSANLPCGDLPHTERLAGHGSVIMCRTVWAVF